MARVSIIFYLGAACCLLAGSLMPAVGFILIGIALDYPETHR